MIEQEELIVKLNEIIELLKAQRTPYVAPTYPIPLWRPYPAYPFQGPYWSVIPPYNPATLMQSGTVQGGPPTTTPTASTRRCTSPARRVTGTRLSA